MSSEVRMCHLGLNNPESFVHCHSGKPGGEVGPYSEKHAYFCSAWNQEFNVCNLVLQPVITVNNITAEEHACSCKNEAEE